jgi:hypothetical protein
MEDFYLFQRQRLRDLEELVAQERSRGDAADPAPSDSRDGYAGWSPRR